MFTGFSHCRLRNFVVRIDIWFIQDHTLTPSGNILNYLSFPFKSFRINIAQNFHRILSFEIRASEGFEVLNAISDLILASRVVLLFWWKFHNFPGIYFADSTFRKWKGKLHRWHELFKQQTHVMNSCASLISHQNVQCRNSMHGGRRSTRNTPNDTFKFKFKQYRSSIITMLHDLLLWSSPKYAMVKSYRPNTMTDAAKSFAHASQKWMEKERTE